jgi:hypothetical protein
MAKILVGVGLEALSLTKATGPAEMVDGRGRGAGADRIQRRDKGRRVGDDCDGGIVRLEAVSVVERDQPSEVQAEVGGVAFVSPIVCV